MKKAIIILTATLVLAACNNKPEPALPETDIALSMAILYNYYSSEYKALALQSYNLASERIETISASVSDPGSLAVVLDIDETVLDNSPYQARCIVEHFSYPVGWDEWCNEAKADPVPGALDFLKLADSLGFKIFYVSNRKEELVYEGTYSNLLQLGFPQVDTGSIMLRKAKSDINPDPSDKTSRRRMIEDRGYKIVMLAGDNLGDFYSDTLSGDLRNQEVINRRGDFGESFIVLPNAMYGNWPSAIGLDGSGEKIIELLSGMTKR